ncbi:hypothetical protein HMP06_1074 [Sphingomonas sp. HMP6]|nr:hypothetical protein HMP06_1074 [Sphingomonas sp. HMP6]
MGFAFARYRNLSGYCVLALDIALVPDTGGLIVHRVVAVVDAGEAVTGSYQPPRRGLADASAIVSQCPKTGSGEDSMNDRLWVLAAARLSAGVDQSRSFKYADRNVQYCQELPIRPFETGGRQVARRLQIYRPYR